MNILEQETIRTFSKRLLTNQKISLFFIFTAILFFVYDIISDIFVEKEFPSYHLIIEMLVFVGVSAALVLGLQDIRQLRGKLLREENRNIILARALAESIDRQLEEWKLTPSEKEVSWFIIKGFRFSEIASFRGVKETTSRLQATNIYAKAGVSGRSEFVAEIIQLLLVSLPESAVSPI